ncbi:MAG: hypothetical protein AAFU73_08165 [Planctomycetota bacterium]
MALLTAICARLADSRLACLGAAAAALALVLGSFYPFAYRYQGPREAPNGARFGPGERVELDGPSVVRSPAAPAWLAPAIASESLVVRLLAHPARAGQRGPARIVTVSDGRLLRNFMVSQKGPDLLVRARRAESDANGAPPLKVDGVFAEPRPVDLEVRFGPELIEILVDGEPRYRDKQPSPPFELWDPAYRLAIGDETDGARGWEGSIEDLSFTVGEETWRPLADPGSLDVPERFTHVPEHARMLLRIDPSWFAVVAGAHLAAFAALGGLWWLARARRRPSLALISLGCLLFGVLLQLGKLFFETRHPELVHALSDGLGGLGGAWLCRSAAGPGAESAEPGR